MVHRSLGFCVLGLGVDNEGGNGLLVIPGGRVQRAALQGL